MRKVLLIGILGISLLFTSFIVIGGIAYSKDVEPTLSISEPNTNTSVKSDSVVIKGSYQPTDRKVWINGKQLTVAGGTFETTYKLKEGENTIDVSAGDWKRTTIKLVITRELTDAEKIAKVSPTPTLTPTSTTKPPVVSLKATVSQKVSVLTPTAKTTLTETPEPLPTPAYTVQTFPAQLEHYLNDVWDEMPGTKYKVYWWDTWEGVDSGHTHLVVEPKFTPTDWQCNRIAQVATIDRHNILGIDEGVVHVVKFDNSGDYCSLRKP